MKQSSFSINFRIAQPFNLDFVIRFYKLKKELNSAKILVAETFGLGRQTVKALPGNLPRVIFDECATMPSVNNVTKSTWIN